MTHPLAGLRILDFTRYLPGAYTGWIAGDMGADVIRVLLALEEPNTCPTTLPYYSKPSSVVCSNLSMTSIGRQPSSTSPLHLASVAGCAACLRSPLPKASASRSGAWYSSSSFEWRPIGA